MALRRLKLCRGCAVQAALICSAEVAIPNLSQFHCQVETLVALDYPDLLGLTGEQFRLALAPLESQVPAFAARPDPASGAAPFVLVIRSSAVRVAQMIARVRRRGKPAVERLFPKRPDDFGTIASVALPGGDAYLLVDIDRGGDTLDMTPDDAQRIIEAHGRSPLTIDEGLALLTHCPEFLQPNHCFSLLASRCGDKRVPALWLSAGAPKLGWCWAGNPHTWLGSASCASRAGGGVRLALAAHAG